MYATRLQLTKMVHLRTGFILLLLLATLMECAPLTPTNPSLGNPKPSAKNSVESGWGILEISPNAFMSVVYKKNFRISVYRNEATDPALVQYFFSPALIIDPSSAASFFNRFTERFEMTFSVLMWDEEYENFVCSEISKKIGQPVAKSSVRTLPIEEIRIDAVGHSEKYDIVNKWTSYASQPSLFSFRLNCLKNDTCSEVAQYMREDPHSFVSEMVVYYSLRTQKSARRMLHVKAEHVQNSALATSLEQRFPKQDTVYMKSDDLKKLTLEIATNVVATEVTDEEFVSQDQSITIGTLLEGVLKAKTVSSASFENQMWSSVFWQDENARPDRITQSMNDAYDKSDSTLKDHVKNYMSDQENSSGSGGFSLGALGVNFSIGGSGASASHLITNEDKEKFEQLVTEAKKVSQWNGDKFKPKEMQLSRINLSGFRTTSVITATQARVTKTTSELSSRINVLPSASSVSALTLQRAELNRIEQRMESIGVQVAQHRNDSLKLNSTVQKLESDMGKIVQPGTIAMTFSSVVPSGWLPCNGMSLECAGQHKRLCDATRATTTPNFKGRFPVGFEGSFARAVGAVGGEEMHTLTVAEMPSHQHSSNYFSVGGGSYKYASGRKWFGNQGTSTGSAGGNQPHNNLPPFLAVQFIIKI